MNPASLLIMLYVREIGQSFRDLDQPLSLHYPANPQEATVTGRCWSSDITEPPGTGVKERAALFAR